MTPGSVIRSCSHPWPRGLVVVACALGLLALGVPICHAGPTTHPASTQPSTAPASQPAKALTAIETVTQLRDAILNGKFEAAVEVFWPEPTRQKRQEIVNHWPRVQEELQRKIVTIAIVESNEVGDIAVVLMLHTKNGQSGYEPVPLVRIGNRWRLFTGSPEILSQEQQVHLEALKKWSDQRIAELLKAQKAREAQSP